MSALWDTRTPPPTVNSPQLAVILIPRQPELAVANGGGYIAASPTSPTSPTVQPEGGAGSFRSTSPSRPHPVIGNNQSMAINTTDNTVVYDAAFALVWATDAKHAMNINEAHAYASCNNCAAVAVAYQVVFVVLINETTPTTTWPSRRTLPARSTTMCVNCITYAFARQLFVTLDEDLSPTAKEELDALWSEIAAYGEQIAAGDADLSNLIDERLEEYTDQIMVIVEADQPGTFSPDLFPSLNPTTTAPTTAVSTTAAPPPSPTSPPPGSAPESPVATGATEPTASATEEPSPPSAISEPSATTDPTTQAPVTDGTTANDSTTAGGTSGGATAGGTTSDGSTSGGSDTSS